MARRRRAIKRETPPDPVFNSVIIARFINKMMEDGKKSTARTIFYEALEQFAKKVRIENQVEAFEQALANAKPTLEVKSRRIGGATYQVPVEMTPERSTSIAMRWIITFAREKPGRSMADALVQELVDCFNNTGSTIKKKDDTHRMAEANKAFAHYKW